MTALYVIAALILIATIALGLVRIVRGPTTADRILAAQLFGTAGTAVLFLLAEAQDMPALQDVGFVFAVLAAVTSIAFAQRFWPSLGSKERP